MNEDTQQFAILVFGFVLLVFVVGSCQNETNRVEHDFEVRMTEATNTWRK